jgi:hypothetical protein
METLGEELLLLAIDPGNGALRHRSRLRYGLMGAELAALAAAGRIGISNGRIVATGAIGASTGNQDLDAALVALVAARRPPRPSTWVSHARKNITESYLERLAAAGAVQRQKGALVTKWPIVDGSRPSAARAKVDAVALGSGQFDAAEAALAGLVSAIGLSTQLYPGWGNRAVRRRLREIAAQQWPADAVRRAIAAAESASAAAG